MYRNQIDPTYTLDAILYNHDFNRHGNGRSVQWSKPASAKTRIEFKVVNGNSGRTANNPNYNWTRHSLHANNVESYWLHVLPGDFFNDFYNGKVRLPYSAYMLGSDEYILIYHRMRSEMPNGVKSDWRYLLPISLYQPD